MIFLSASIPSTPEQLSIYPTADAIAIREAIKALSIVILPHTKLVWGGHPSITPLIRFIIKDMNLNVQDHVTVYQSAYFEKDFPETNKEFESITITAAEDSLDQSLIELRKRMIEDNPFNAAFFIGGMKGAEREFELFKKSHPKSKCYPIASTGGAAEKIYGQLEIVDQLPMLTSRNYLALFETLASQLK